MAKKRSTTKRRTRRAPAAKSTRRRSSVKSAGFNVTPMNLVLGAAGAFLAPMLLNKVPIEDGRVRNALGLGAALVLAKPLAKQSKEILPAVIGFGIGAGVMLAADLFPEMAERMKALPGSPKPKTIGRLNRAELDRVRDAVANRLAMRGSGMPVINGAGVPVINGLPDMEQFT